MLIVPLLHVLSSLSGAPVPPGEAVIRAAYAQYAGKWFHTATFVQKTTLIAERRVETWYVAMELPGKLRIDVAPSLTGRAIIYRGDSSYQYGDKRLRVARPEVNPLLLLTHDIHVLPPEKTIPSIKALGFDLSKTSTREWGGQTVIVVGALKNDTTSNQFWLEQNRKILVRMIHNANDPRTAFNAIVSEYHAAGGGWLEQRVDFYTGGRRIRLEEYNDVKVNAKLAPDLFAPEIYKLPAWVGPGNDLFGHLPNPILPPRGGGH